MRFILYIFAYALTDNFESDVGLDCAVDAVGGAAEVGARVEAGHVQQHQLRPLRRLLTRRQHLVLKIGDRFTFEIMKFF